MAQMFDNMPFINLRWMEGAVKLIFQVLLFFFRLWSETALYRLEEEKNSCKGLVKVEECQNALKDFDNNKSPGSDCNDVNLCMLS